MPRPAAPASGLGPRHFICPLVCRDFVRDQVVTKQVSPEMMAFASSSGAVWAGRGIHPGVWPAASLQDLADRPNLSKIWAVMGHLIRERASRARCSVYDCGTCALYLNRECPGCARGNIRIIHDGGAPCAIYACVRDLGIAGCHDCSETTCHVAGWAPRECPLRERYGAEAGYDEFRRAAKAAKAGADQAEQPVLAKRAMDRVRLYAQVLDDYARRELPTISSHHLARSVGVRSGLVRRDLAAFDHIGTPGRGYEVQALRRAINRALQLDRPRAVVWLGAQRLAQDQAAVDALAAMNCRLVALCDLSNRHPGKAVRGLSTRSFESALAQAKSSGAEIAVLATEEAAKPEVIAALAQAGVRAVLNLTDVPLVATGQMVVEQADVSSQLLRLLSRMATRGG